MVWAVGLGIFDIIWALILFFLFLGSQFSFICGVFLGVFSLIAGIGIINRTALMRRIFLAGSLPLCLMSLLNLIIFTGKDVQEGFRMNIVDIIVFSGIYLIIPLAVNFIILTNQKVKREFK
jgi:hypothetical protein